MPAKLIGQLIFWRVDQIDFFRATPCLKGFRKAHHASAQIAT
jgi:hypothetical protein